ncbi:MAG: toll/interleukin-1 receptor domain-containing protein [Deltaproteobacteria bacterium]|nr:toll/interleukin-1 receptor domain-containing protein [Deltaproteobacteria bacterium]
MKQNERLKLFICYSHRDEEHIEEFIKHITPLKSNDLIENWYDRKIIGGQDFQNTIANNLENADIVCLFISANFLASASCRKEKKDALGLKKKKGIEVVPIILSACGWLDDEEISSLLALPEDGNPISGFTDSNEAWKNVYDGIKDIIEDVGKNKRPKMTTAFPIPPNAVLADVVEKYDEEGDWAPLVQYITGDSSEKYAQAISVDEAKYTFHRGNVKIFFDFSVDLKEVPSGSALAINELPFKVDSRNVYEFKVRQTGLNHSEDLTVSSKRNFTSLDLSYITDGSEGPVRLWGYIEYDCNEKVLWDSPDP